VQDYRGSYASDEAALQSWIKKAQPKTYPKDGAGNIIWNGEYGTDQRTKPGDISLMCAPARASFLSLLPCAIAPPCTPLTPHLRGLGAGRTNRLYNCHLDDAKAIELFKRLPSLAGPHLVYL
jgi:hypothetical protein